MIETEMNLPIRPYDVDVAGIVSNIVYVRWLEDLRMELFSTRLAPKVSGGRELMTVVARTEINYRKSLRFYDQCIGRVRVVEIGRTSLTLDASFVNLSGETVADARQTNVHIDITTGRPSSLPEDLRALFEQG